MKIAITRISLAMVLILIVLASSSCAKKTNTSSTTNSNDTEQTSASDNTMAEVIANDIDAIGSEITDGNSLTTFKTNENTSASGLAISPCATITGIGTNIVTVDFGINGCYCTDGRLRSGQLIYTISSAPGSHYRTPGFSMSVGSQNYKVDSVNVTILDKTITNTTPSSIPTTGTPTINLTWAITATISIAKPNNTALTWICSRVKALINTNDPTCYKGQQLPIDWTKANVQLNGISSGTNTVNESFTALISNVVRNYQCSPVNGKTNYHPFISGTIIYTPGTRPQRLVDFGNGTCDNVATLSISSHTYSITLF